MKITTALVTLLVAAAAAAADLGHIMGHVYNQYSQPVAGITVTLGGYTSGNFVTPEDGHYKFQPLTYGQSYTVTPSSSGCSGFTPPEYTVSDL